AFARLDGGTGTDPLRLDGPGFTLDLTDRLLAGRLRSIEILDLSGPGNFTLTLDALAVLRLAETTNTLLVKADAGDTIHRGLGWTQAADEVIGSATFHV